MLTTPMIRLFLSLAFSLVILGIVISRTDVQSLGVILRQAQLSWIVAALLMSIPLTILLTLRFKWIIPPRFSFKFTHLIGMVCAANYLNLILPSKIGDLAKGLLLRRDYPLSKTKALMIVLIEKIIDMTGMFLITMPVVYFSDIDTVIKLPFLFFLFGMSCVGLFLLFIPKYPAYALVLIKPILPRFLYRLGRRCILGFEFVRKSHPTFKKRVIWVIALSMLTSCFHLTQLWFLFRAVSSSIPYLDHLALAPLAVLASLFPFTLSGIGVRDAAMVVLFTPYVGTGVATAFGLLATFRFIVLGFPGIFTAHSLRIRLKDVQPN